MTYDEFFETVSCSLKTLEYNKSFTLKELMGPSWIPITKGDKIRFGKIFKAAVESGEVFGVKYSGKKANNSACYTKNS